jgi:superfamily I DNA/RNA helicase
MGVRQENIAVLNRRRNGVKRLQAQLRGTGIEIETFHALKGLEYEVVFLSQMQETFKDLENEQEISQERRLVYMSMTRAQTSLYLSFEGRWPEALKEVLEKVDRVWKKRFVADS